MPTKSPSASIAFVTPRFYPCKGGYENYILSLARYLHGQGNRVSVLTTTALDLESFWIPGRRTLAAGQDMVDGIDVFRFPILYGKWHRYPRRLLSLLPDWRLKAKFARPAFFVDGLPEKLHDLHPDVIHVGPLPYSSLMYFGVVEARRVGIPVLATPCTHFGEDTNAEVSRHYVQDFQIQVLNCCEKVLTLTDAERKRLQTLGVRSEKLLFTGAGVDIGEVTGGDAEEFRRRYRIADAIVLHLGMRAPDKGSISVVEAMKLLWNRGVKAHLVLAGPSLSTFDEYLKAAGANCERILTLGVVDDQEKRDALAAATVVVQPSRVESLGLILLEAWTNEKPVIAADIAVSRELVEASQGGFLVPFGDPPALADAIQKLLQDPAMCASMGKSGLETVVRRFQAKTILQKVAPLFSTQNKPSLTI